MLAREEEMKNRLFDGLRSIPHLHLLADHIEERLGIFSFYSETIHYNLFVKLLNDRFGIQVRGGCSCAGTYGHYLLHVDPHRSHRIAEQIDHGDLSNKPGWVRLSIHPTMTDAEIDFILAAIRETTKRAGEWEKDYSYSSSTNEYRCLRESGSASPDVASWFKLGE